MSKLSKQIFAAKEKQLEVEKLEKLAAVAYPECNNHAGVAPAHIY